VKTGVFSKIHKDVPSRFVFALLMPLSGHKQFAFARACFPPKITGKMKLEGDYWVLLEMPPPDQAFSCACL